MLDYTLDTANAILHIRPKSWLEQVDFEQLAQPSTRLSPERGDLAGLIIETPAFLAGHRLEPWLRICAS